ncbi:MAG TPA: ABC transporter permease [Bryobacteraceae bacterium]|jgi:predicted permease
MSWLTRFRNAVRPGALEQELDEEMRDHVERRIQQLEASGVAHEEAVRRVGIRFGNISKLREESRDARLTRFVDGTIQDLRYALRLMVKSPGFTATIVVSLGLAIGANTAVFSILDAALLRPLPVADPERLISLSAPGITDPGADPSPERLAFSYPQLKGFRAALGTGAARLALFNFPRAAEVRGVEADAPTEHAVSQFVSGDAFQMLGVTPALGRLFTADDDRTPGAHPLVVLSYDYWQSRFHGDPGVLGRRIIAGAVPNEIIGVAQKGFFGIEPGQMVQLWRPAMQYDKQAFEEAGWSWFEIIGRLAPGATTERVATALQPVWSDNNAAMLKRMPTLPQAIREQFLKSKVIVRLAPNGVSGFRRAYETPLWVIFCVALAILAIACSNVASLLLARAASRASEVAMRVSLGAGRLRLVRQLLTESVFYALVAGALGWILAKAIAPLLVEALSSKQQEVALLLPMNSTVLLFSTAVALLAAVLFGLPPAWQASRSQPIQVMRGVSGQAGKLKLGRFFVSVQVAFAFGLVILGAAFLFSLRNLVHVDPGFRPEGVTAYTILLGDPKLSESAGNQLTRQLRDRVGALPGVTGTAGTAFAIFTGSSMTDQIIIPGRPPSEQQELFYAVTDEYFRTMGTPLMAGRDFERGDAEKKDETPAIVNQAFAAKYFAGADPMGQRFRDPSDRPTFVIVGIAGNTHYDDLRGTTPPIVYFPLKGLSGWLYVRSAGAATPVPEIDREARAVRPGMRVGEVYPLESLIRGKILKERLLAVTGGTLGALGLVLAAIGLFGLLNYSVERRTKEIGIRAALGARFGQIVGLVLREAVGLVAFGLVLGFGAAVFTLGALEKLLFGIRPADPQVAVAGCLVFLIATLVAAGLPARRAAAVDPMTALRSE